MDVYKGNIVIFSNRFDIIYGKVILHFSGFRLFSSRMLTGEMRIADSFDSAAFRMLFFGMLLFGTIAGIGRAGNGLLQINFNKDIEKLLSYFLGGDANEIGFSEKSFSIFDDGADGLVAALAGLC